MSSPAKTFLDEIDAFLNRSGMTASAFGRQAVNDPNFVWDLRNGRSPNLRLVGQVQSFIAGQDAQRPATQPEQVAS
jgi:hypothetical protein